MTAAGRERSDDLLADDDRGEIGRIFVVRAPSAQGHGDATGLAADTAAADTYLIADGDISGAASATAMAAVFTDQRGDVAQAMEHAVQALVLLDDIDVRNWTTISPDLAITVSCGVATGSLHDARAILVAADAALLDAKRAGRNRIAATTAPAPTP